MYITVGMVMESMERDDDEICIAFHDMTGRFKFNRNTIPDYIAEARIDFIRDPITCDYSEPLILIIDRHLVGFPYTEEDRKNGLSPSFLFVQKYADIFDGRPW